MTALDEIANKSTDDMRMGEFVIWAAYKNQAVTKYIAIEAAEELAALRKVAAIAVDVNEWLIKIDLGGTGHQRSLAGALKELEATK